MVLTKVSKCWVEVMDPADGRFYWHSRESFRERWTGVWILLAPGDSFEGRQPKDFDWFAFLAIDLASSLGFEAGVFRDGGRDGSTAGRVNGGSGGGDGV